MSNFWLRKLRRALNELEKLKNVLLAVSVFMAVVVETLREGQRMLEEIRSLLNFLG